MPLPLESKSLLVLFLAEKYGKIITYILFSSIETLSLQPGQSRDNGMLAAVCHLPLHSLAKRQGEELEEGVNAETSNGSICLRRSERAREGAAEN